MLEYYRSVRGLGFLGSSIPSYLKFLSMRWFVCGHMFASIVVSGFYKLGTRKSVYAVGVCVGYMVLLLHQYF